MAMKLVKGSPEAKAYMAKLRALAQKRREVKAGQDMPSTSKGQKPLDFSGKHVYGAKRGGLPGHPTEHDVPHSSEFCNKCAHETYCEICSAPRRNPKSIWRLDPSKAGRMLSKAEIERATDIEMEHTKDRTRARKIAMDHFREDPNYYRKLARCGIKNPPRRETPAEKALNKQIEQAYYRVARGVQVGIMDIPKIFADAKALLAAGRTDIDQVLIEVVKKYQFAGGGGRLLNNPHGKGGAYFIIDPATNRILWIVRGHPMYSFNNSVKLAAKAAAKLGRNVIHVVHPYVPKGWKKGTVVTPLFYSYGANEIDAKGAIYKRNPGGSVVFSTPAKLEAEKIAGWMSREGVAVQVEPTARGEWGVKVPPNKFAEARHAFGRVISRNPQFKARFLASDGVEIETKAVRAHGVRSAMKKAERMTLDMPARFRGARSEIEITRCNPKTCRNNSHGRRNPTDVTGKYFEPGFAIWFTEGQAEAYNALRILKENGIEANMEAAPSDSKKFGKWTYKIHVTPPTDSVSRMILEGVLNRISKESIYGQMTGHWESIPRPKSIRPRAARRNPLLQMVTLANPSHKIKYTTTEYLAALKAEKAGKATARQKQVIADVRKFEPRRNPVSPSKPPFRHGQIITVAQALDYARRSGNASLVRQCEEAIKLCKKANGPAQKVRFDLVAMGDPRKIDAVMAGVEYGQTDETMYKPTKGSKKGQHLYRHDWGEGTGKRRPVPLIATPGGKALVMPLGSKQKATDWLRG